MHKVSLINSIAGKLICEGLNHEVVTKEKALKKTSNCALVVQIHQVIEKQYNDIVSAMAKMLTTNPR